MDPQRRLVALWLCRARALLGAKLVLFPRLATKVWLGSPSPLATATVRMVGVRDVALGLGAIAGVRGGNQAPEWMGWGAAADGIDALALLTTPGLAKRARLVGVLAAGAAAVGMALAWELADERATAEFEARHAARLDATDALPTASDRPVVEETQRDG